MTRRHRLAVIAIASLLQILGAAARRCSAHPARLVAATVVIEHDGAFQANLRFDLLAFALNDTPARIGDAPMNALLDGPAEDLQRQLDDARRRLIGGLVVACDNAPAKIDAIRFPTIASVYAQRDSGITPRLPILGDASFAGHVPPGASSISFQFPPVMGSVVLTVERPEEEPYSEPVEPGQASTMLAVKIDAALGAPSAGAPAAARNSAPSPAMIPEPPGRISVGLRYLALGFQHIVPEGPDHILFVLCLFLLSTHIKPLLWQITAFTLAHSITLALSLYGVCRLSPSVVEPLIAWSIAFVAVENLFTARLKPWRPFVVFGFGLVHGLGFASVLNEIGLPRRDFVTALLGFNIGVEVGQLTVVAAAFLVLGWWRRRAWYRQGIVFPASTAIAAIAVFWTIQRVWFTK